MRVPVAGVTTALILTFGGSAQAAIATFDSEYLLRYSVESTLNPSTGELVSQSVPVREYTGSFRFALESVDESVTAGPSPGLVRRTVEANLSFEPFNFAPDLQALVDADAPGLPVPTSALEGTIRFVRLEDLAGTPGSFVYEEMSDVFAFSEGQSTVFSPSFFQSYFQYHSVRAELDDPATPMSLFLASGAPGDIAAYLLATPQVWQIGNDLRTYPTGFTGPQGPIVGRNSAGTLRFTSITLVDDGAGPVPEPGTWALMILGFGGAGAALRRRRALTLGYARNA